MADRSRIFNLRKVLGLMIGIIAGNVIAERFVLQANEGDGTGFIPVRAGVGLDEFARAAVIVPLAGFAERMLKNLGV